MAAERPARGGRRTAALAWAFVASGWALACTSAAGGTVMAQAQPSLAIPTAVPAAAGASVGIGVRFASGGAAISSMAFSIDFDQGRLRIDPTDTNGDGTPDAIRLRVPGAFVASAQVDTADGDGEIDVLVADVMPPLASVPDGELLVVTFEVPPEAPSGVAAVAFAKDPAPSFGSAAGESIEGRHTDGSVVVAGVSRAYLPLARSDRRASH